jgi:tRNA-specific 2-thiouridylase
VNGRFFNIDLLKQTHPGASVLVSMSGGVDSAVAALLIVRAGFRAIGLTMKNYCYGDTEVPDRSCCSIEAIDDARRECERLGMTHRVVDVEDFFSREVVDNFLSEYQNTRTPNPCVRCNTIVRFDTLLQYADKFGADFVATGHYARVFEDERGGLFLARAVNRAKDQSYFLSGVHDEKTLGRIVFPLGDYDKATVRERAKDADMAVADKSESQEVCFVPEGTLRSFLEANKLVFKPGPIENTKGEVVGEHQGLTSYTIGQRRHLGIATGSPQYVIRLDGERNVLVVGDNDDLLEKAFACTLQWFNRSTEANPDGVTAQIRYRHKPAAVSRIDTDGGICRVEFSEPQRAICPGQTVAFYRGDVVVGSGVIDDVVSK